MEHWGAFYNAWSAFIAAARFAAVAAAASTSTSVVEGLYKNAMAQVSDYPDQAGRGVEGSAFETLGYTAWIQGRLVDVYGCWKKFSK